MSALFSLCARAIDRFGWPGGTVILGFIFVEMHGTKQQKQEIVEMLIHPDSPGGQAIGLLVLVTSGVFVAQHYYWKRKFRTLELEKDRLATWKTEHQQKRIPVPLHHTNEPSKVAATGKEGS